jgi:hypothetical protein
MDDGLLVDEKKKMKFGAQTLSIVFFFQQELFQKPNKKT